VQDAGGGACPECGAPMTRQLTGGMCPACLLALALQGSDEADEGEASAGAPLHSYRIVTVLASEAGRTRYLARGEGFHSLVSLEAVAARALGGTNTTALQARIAELRALRGPAIARVLEGWVEAGGDCWVASEYVPGRAITGGDPLDVDGLLSVFGQVCSALGTAHEQGVVHGRLEPSSIVLAAAATGLRPCLTGFGVCARPPSIADDIAGLGRILAAMAAGLPVAARVASLVRQAEGSHDTPTFPTTGAMASALAALGLQNR
jgi:serine/threonine protein kinase